jgi:hypothetical protein
MRRRKALVPGGFGGVAGGLGVPGGVHVIGHDEGLVRPAQGGARELDFFGTQGLAVRLGGVGAVRAALADRRLADDERGRVGLASRVGDGAVHGVHIVAVDRADHVPAAGGETQSGVVDEPGRDLAVDRDAVVIVERDQLVELPRAGQGHRFVADALHQAAVTQKHVSVVVDDLVAVAVEFGRQQLLGERHAHRVGDALAQRAGGGLDAGRVADLGVAGRLAVQLAEVLQLLHRQRVAREVQERIDEHGAVAVAEHEPVAIGPLRVHRVVLEVARPQRHGDVGHAHGGAGMPGVGGLHGVHGQRADGVGHGQGRDVDDGRVAHAGDLGWKRAQRGRGMRAGLGKTPDFNGAPQGSTATGRAATVMP